MCRDAALGQQVPRWSRSQGLAQSERGLPVDVRTFFMQEQQAPQPQPFDPAGQWPRIDIEVNSLGSPGSLADFPKTTLRQLQPSLKTLKLVKEQPLLTNMQCTSKV